MLKHFCGPSYPIHQVSGTKVLDPFCPYEERITTHEAIQILTVQDPRRVSRHGSLASKLQNCHEGVSLG